MEQIGLEAFEAGAPYLSVVVAARNDDHGGGFLGRMQVFVDAFVAQCARHRVAAELVIVEWNPAPGRPGLVDAIRWPRGTGAVNVRIIDVAHELHARFAHSDRLQLFQMIAKNVGIRRARAPFVLATNVDLIFSDGIMRRLGERSLDAGELYRVDRLDVDAAIPRDADIEAQLEWCERHTIRVSSRHGTKDLRTGAFYPIYAGPLDLPRFAWSSFRLEGLGGMYARGRRLAERRALQRGAERHEFDGESPSARPGLRQLVLRSRVRPNTNACGDFTLMARERWVALRGYPQLPMYSLHIDSLLLYMSRYAGLRERNLEAPIYHLDHETGFRPDADGRGALFAWLSEAGIPWITSSMFGAYVVSMAKTRRPLDLNDDAWGLGGEDLPEATVAC